MFESVDTIFFDVGNTLYISPEMEKEYPRQLVELLARARGLDLTEAKAILSEVSKKYVTKVRAMKDLGFSRPQVHEAFCKVDPRKYLSKDTELVSAMTTLASNYRLGIISNFKQSHLEEILDVLGLSKDLFHWFVTEDIVQEIKPAPEPFLKAVEMSAARVDQCLYVGDSPSKDMRPAKEIGMATVLVRQNPTKDDLSYTDCSIADVKQLIELLPRTQSR